MVFPTMKKILQIQNRSAIAILFLFSLSSSFLYFIYVAPGIVNTYLFMMQAHGMIIRENIRTMGVQMYEQVVRGAYALRNNSSINDTEIPINLNQNESFIQTTTFLPPFFTYLPNQLCPERLPFMRGAVDVNMSEVDMADVHKMFAKDFIKMGGHWRPSDCVPPWKVAILIPFRNRHEHLPVLFKHLIPMLQKQRLQFAFYVIEQTGNQQFNRAMLFNIGFLEAMKDLEWDCLIFHDVDHIPENDRNYYGCQNMPRHFAAKLDKYMYLVQNAGYTVSRPEGDIGKYKSIPHHHRGEVQFLGRYGLLRRSKERQKMDGLNNLNYYPNIMYDALYKNITVDLSPELAMVSDY
ncbi:beta-1,4-galactosyltransferase 5 isoform X3 [Dendrobates tinctorius]|uniref:beta-1,4-galactosyltransferase 5 isoform X3 n=1 Tax=Dendrobates tinctorius TaxID=92724 RepID=UPI003CCA10AE